MAIERTLVQIRERSILELLDLGLVVVRQRPITLGLSAVAGIAPFYLLNLWLFAIGGEEATWFLGSTLWMLEAPLATAPLTVVLGGMMFGSRQTPAKVLGSLYRASFRLILLQGFLRYLVFFFIPVRMAFANPIIILERGKLWKIFSRGGDLANGRGSELVVLWFCQALLTFLFSMMFLIGVSRIIQVFLAEDLSFEPPEDLSLASWKIQVPIWIVTSFFAIVRFLLYIDQRIRLEGWEVELRLREVASTMKEASRW